MPAPEQDPDRQEWRARPLRAGLLRIAVFVVPIASSVAVAVFVSGLLSPAASFAGLVLRAGAVLVPATLALWGVDRVARRFLPLAALLRLSLAFPDKAPSRYAVARLTNSTRELQRRVAAVRDGQIDEEPAEAAKAILALVAALSHHDRRTRGHSERVRIYVDLLAEEIGMSAGQRDRLRWAALLHDVGKLTVPERILNKAGRPTDDEWEVLRRHPGEGARLCSPLMEWLGDAGRAIAEHHERYDGTGYPAGLAGSDISLAGRILAVADSYEVMTAARAYKRPMNAAAAREELARCASTQFDPFVVRMFLQISLGRLRLAMGPLSWAAQWPVLARLPQVGAGAGQAGATLGSAAALGMAGLWSPLAAAAEAPRTHAEPATPDGAALPPAAAEPSAAGPATPDPAPQPSPAAEPDDVPPTRTPEPEAPREQPDGRPGDASPTGGGGAGSPPPQDTSRPRTDP